LRSQISHLGAGAGGLYQGWKTDARIGTGALMPAMWKIKREILRVFDRASFSFISKMAPARRRAHDARKPQHSRYTAGQVTVGTKIALYLLYQPQGLLKSSVDTCRHFAAKGFSVFIVSNAPLSDADRATLSTVSFGVLERENFGYDFGGYRDGILHLLDTGVAMDKLLIMNDSVWFPTFADEDFLDHILASDTDFYGAVLSQRKAHMDERHLQSYAVAFNKKLLESTDFARFWRELSLSSNREWTIRHCEVRLTLDLHRLGYSFGARWGFESLAAVLDQLSYPQLQDMLHLEADLEPRRRKAVAALTANYGAVTWREDVKAYVDSRKFRNQMMLLHPEVMSVMNFPFAKKSLTQNYAHFRPVYARVLKDRCDPTILQEIVNWD
jgi:hypothetical protein